jgi:hypothetical protein
MRGRCIIGASALLGCSGRAKPVDLTIHLDPPPAVDAGPDISCIGVVGFEVTISSGGINKSSGPVLNSGPILTAGECAIGRPVTIGDLDPDSAAIVTITGYDGAGRDRVRGSMSVANLRGGALHLAVAPSGMPPPVLVMDKGALLSGIASPSAITGLVVTSAVMRPTTWFAVDESLAGAYFSVDPGAYGYAGLSPEGLNVDTKLDVSFTLVDGGPMPQKRVTLAWTPPFYVAR